MSRAKARKMAARFHRPTFGVLVLRHCRALGITVTPEQEAYLRTLYAKLNTEPVLSVEPIRLYREYDAFERDRATFRMWTRAVLTVDPRPFVTGATA